LISITIQYNSGDPYKLDVIAGKPRRCFAGADHPPRFWSTSCPALFMIEEYGYIMFSRGTP
jgi:hypothetical protein